MRLFKKRILLGVTGSIAAYKSAELVRLLIKEGAEVQVIMTNSAHDFITPLTLGTLSKNPVLTQFSEPISGSWNNHVALGLWADAFVIAPISANSIAKLAFGKCDDLLSAVYLSARCPVFIAPAMDLDMFAHPATTQNISQLVSFGNKVIGPDSGELASGLKGAGRMVEPEEICSYIIKAISPDPVLAGKKILISAGPTREPIDPVRYISNQSSGKMGLAIAEEFTNRGGVVTIVSGPGVNAPQNSSIKNIEVVTAEQMFNACIGEFKNTDIAIMAAAVADFTPKVTTDSKIKKDADQFILELKKTKDILGELGKIKSAHQLVVGFALETDDELKNAILKLERKNLDLIILNSLNDKGAGFNFNTNKITIIDKNKNVTPYDLKSKKEVASDIADKIISCFNK